ncbi:MAG TPA: hypothetical protein VK833_00080 [Gillisia sp.]|nr:hypothetical protein [Gillisia sp.]
MITLIKIIIVLVMSFFTVEKTETVDEPEKEITLSTKYQQQFRYQKMDMLTRCEKTCIPS